MKKKPEELLEETRRLLWDLKRCGSFYPSAIELNRYINDSIDGEKFENRINTLVEKLNNKLK